MKKTVQSLPLSANKCIPSGDDAELECEKMSWIREEKNIEKKVPSKNILEIQERHKFVLGPNIEHRIEVGVSLGVS